MTGRRRRVPWCGVLGFTETPSDDGRVLDWAVWEPPLPVLKRAARSGRVRQVGSIERITADGCVIRAAGSIDARFAGQELTGGIDVETAGSLFADTPAVDEAGCIHVGGTLVRFVVGDRPAWAGVRLIVEQSPTPSKLGETA